MANGFTDLPLIRTKLHRPQIASNHIHRIKLIKRLNRRRERSIVLVSAPAGYGKTTLLSCWLETSDVPNAWVSLDADDNDIRQFLSYFIAAVQTIFPGAVHQTQALLYAADFPPASVLARSLINELDRIEKTFTLVLDDYHFINEKTVHGLLNKLLHYCPGSLQLVLSSRRDPPLAVTNLRAKGRIAEIRSQDLRFSMVETAAYFQEIVGISLDEDTVSRLEEKSEGWITGLRLLALSIRHGSDLKRVLDDLQGRNRHVRDYLMEEVFLQQSRAVEEHMMATAILNRFCAPLCDAVCTPIFSTRPGMIDGSEFIHRMEQANLFMVALDDQGVWFRYHHLFQELLLRKVKRRYSPAEISDIHKRAGAWLASNGLMEEALHHLLVSGDTVGAAKLIAHHRQELMNREQWYRLRHWLSLMPRKAVENDPDLLMLEAWGWLGFPEIVDAVNRIEEQLTKMSEQSAFVLRLQGELNMLKGLKYYHIADGRRALAYSRQAMENLPLEQTSTRGMAIIIMALAYQMIGDFKRSRSVVLKALGEKRAIGTTYEARLYSTFCFIHSMEADLTFVKQTAGQLLAFGRGLNLPESVAHGHYFLGVSHYDRNDLNSAEKHLAAVVKDPVIVNIHNYSYSAFALALTYQAQGWSDKAQELVESVITMALRLHHSSLLEICRAFQVELSIRRGKVSEAIYWVKTYDPYPFSVAYRFYMPQLTLAKWFLHQNSAKRQRQATELLSKLYDFFSSIHNTRLLVEVLALQALLYAARGDEPSALETLARAIALTHPGKYIRLFVDLGPKMADLFKHLAKRDVYPMFTGMIMTAFNDDKNGTIATATDDRHLQKTASPPHLLDEPLTTREIEILALLEQGHLNKEIAEKLFISPATVKKHNTNLYRKLNVHSRQQAISKAAMLGILSQR